MYIHTEAITHLKIISVKLLQVFSSACRHRVHPDWTSWCETEFGSPSVSWVVFIMQHDAFLPLLFYTTLKSNTSSE